MIGTKLYQKKERLYLFLSLYGVLSLIGVAISAVSISRSEQVSGVAGFMTVFGAGMAILTWVKGKKPLVTLHEDRLELNQTNRPEYVRYKDIAGVEQRSSGQLALKVRDGHAIKIVMVYGQYLAAKEAEQLAVFLTKKGWKH